MPKLGSSTRDFVDGGQLRGGPALLDEFDVAYRTWWAVISPRDKSSAEGENVVPLKEVNKAVVGERFWALSWVTGYDDAEWDEECTLDYYKKVVAAKPADLPAQARLSREISKSDPAYAMQHLDTLIEKLKIDEIHPALVDELAEVFRDIGNHAMDEFARNENSDQNLCWIQLYAWEQAIKLNPARSGLRRDFLHNIHNLIDAWMLHPESTWPPQLKKAATELKLGLDFRTTVHEFNKAYERSDERPHNPKIFQLFLADRFIKVAKGVGETRSASPSYVDPEQIGESLGARAAKSPGQAADEKQHEPGRGTKLGTVGLLVVVVALFAGFYFVTKESNEPDQSGDAGCLECGRWGDLADSKVAINGIGPVRVGMTVDEASTALGGIPLVRCKRCSRSDGCYYLEGPKGLTFMVKGDRMARVDVDGPEFRTVSGAKVGDTEAQVKDFYANRLKIEPHKYHKGGNYLVFVPKDSKDQAYRMIFETNGTVVTKYRAGRLPEVELVEGCL